MSPRVSVLSAELLAGERLLWHGQPERGLRFSTADALAMPFSLMWAAFAFFWELTAIRQGAPLFFVLWGLPFVICGLYLIGGRFVWDAYRRARTFYGVTDSRILIVNRGFGGAVKSVSLAAIGELVMNRTDDGSGTLRFGRGPVGAGPWFEGPGWPGMYTTAPAFERIEGVREVHALIRRTQGAR